MDSQNQAQAASAQEAVLPERRAWVRFGCDLEAACKPKGRLKDAGWTAQVRNLSQGGLGLVLRHRFEKGTPLSIELRSQNRQVCRSVPARVESVTPKLAVNTTCPPRSTFARADRTRFITSTA